MSEEPANYDASSIRVLSDDDVVDAFDWAKVGALAAEHAVPTAWVERGLEACRRAGVAPSYFIDRYLKGLDVPLDPSVNEAMADLLRER